MILTLRWTLPNFLFDLLMPTILRTGPYRFFFYAGDQNEPVHVHVERDDHIAKFWLKPPRMQNSGNFGRSELVRIQKLIQKHEQTILEAWDDFFSD